MRESRKLPSNNGKTSLTNLPDYQTNLSNISTTLSARVSGAAVVSIDYEESHVSDPAVAATKRKRPPCQLKSNKKQSITISIAELFGDNR